MKTLTYYLLYCNYVRLLEKDINDNPEYWLWSHRRWKQKPTNNEIKTHPNV